MNAFHQEPQATAAMFAAVEQGHYQEETDLDSTMFDEEDQQEEEQENLRRCYQIIQLNNDGIHLLRNGQHAMAIGALTQALEAARSHFGTPSDAFCLDDATPTH